jgi:hypothetical protein
MMRKIGVVIPITIICWLIGTALYAYDWVTTILAEPGLPTYERGAFLPLLGFALYRLPYLLLGLVIIIILELLLVPGPDRNPPSMV